MSESDDEPMERPGDEWVFESTIKGEKKKSFWTPAERAGLKAMGIALRTFKPMSEYPTLEDGLRAHRGIIRAYIQAARKSKEE